MSTTERTLPYGQNSPATVIAVVLALGAALFALIGAGGKWPPAWIVAVLLALGAALVPLSLLMAKQWEKAVVLRFGKLHAIRGPGLFMIVPFVDTVTAWIDQRIQTTEFNAEQALTAGGVRARGHAQRHAPSSTWRSRSPVVPRRSS